MFIHRKAPGRFRPVRILMVLAVAGGAMLLPPAAVSAPRAEKPPLQILVPADGSVVSSGKVLLIGRALGVGSPMVMITINGQGAGNAAIERNGFHSAVQLSPGKNVVKARAGNAESVVTVTVDAKGTYVYHPTPEKCSGCHGASGKGYAIDGPQDAACYRCHKKLDRAKLVHGPIGTGNCSACHDAHGSSHKALTVADPEALCSMCHDQDLKDNKGAEKHLKSARGKGCTTTACHDPHSSNKAFLQR